MPASLALTLGIALATLLLLLYNMRTMHGLRRSLRQLMDELTDGIVILAEQPGRAWCNEAARTMLALPDENGLPANQHSFAASRLLVEICEGAAGVRRGGVLPPLELVDANGQFRSWRQTPINTTIAGTRMIGVMLQDRTEVHTLSHLLEESRRRDPLTGLATLEMLHDRTGQALETAARLKTGVALLMIEVDQFEEIFEERGWAAASELLIQAAISVSAQVRAMDLMARVGQNRFAVVLNAVPDANALPRVAERFLAAMRFDFTGGAAPVAITGSVGIARAGIDGATSLRLLETASNACRRAREEGGDRGRFYEAAADETHPVDTALVAELRQALDQGNFLMRYQPIVALRNRRITGYEALMRWTHPTRGEVSPAEFIATAERSGLIHALGDYALTQAVRDASRWPRDVQVSINMSVVELTTGEAPHRILTALSAADMAPSRVRIEITETARIPDLGRLRHAVDQVRALGVTVALDDFGTGHSSLTHLQSLTFDCLKIDGRFVRDIETPRTATMIRMLIAYGRQIGVSVVAEGVETEEQAAALLAMGCSHAQGWLFGRPMLAEQLMNPQRVAV